MLYIVKKLNSSFFALPIIFLSNCICFEINSDTVAEGTLLCLSNKTEKTPDGIHIVRVLRTVGIKTQTVMEVGRYAASFNECVMHYIRAGIKGAWKKVDDFLEKEIIPSSTIHARLDHLCSPILGNKERGTVRPFRKRK